MNSVTCAKYLMPVLALMILTAATSESQTRPRLEAGPQRIRLLTGWQFREASKDRWYPAEVPGCVHTDLLKNKLIEDPFYRDNEQKLQWIGKTDWEYQSDVYRPS